MPDASIERRTANADGLSSVLAAARETFAKFGVHRTRMEDVADAAGIKRQYLYRYVAGRDELVELVLFERCKEFTAELLAQAEAFDGDLDTDLVTLLVSCVLLGRQDAEFNYLSEAVPRHRLSELLTSSTSPIHALARAWLAPVLDRARREGRLRDAVDDDDGIVDWLTGILLFVAPRDDLTEAALRTMMARFAVPSVLTEPNPRRSSPRPAKRSTKRSAAS